MQFEHIKRFNLQKEVISKKAEKVDLSVNNGTTNNIDIDAIIEKLGNGDLSVLKEFDAQNISYKLTKSSNGYTITFSYNDTNYSITYHSNNSINNESDTAKYKINNLAALLKKIEDAETEVNPDKPNAKTESFDFDYDAANVNKDANIDSFYNENNIPDDKKPLGFVRKSNINSGAWDNLFKELDKLKPQLLNYIKTKMAALGMSYDEDAAEKILNVHITKSVQAILNMIDTGSVYLTSGNTNTNEIKTIEDLVNSIKQDIDLTLPFARTDSYLNADGYLLDTADYYLTDDEKKLKTAMQIENGRYDLVVENKDEIEQYVDVYAEHMKKVLKIDFPDFDDERIDRIVSAGKMAVMALIIRADMREETLYFSEVLNKFKEMCINLANNPDD